MNATGNRVLGSGGRVPDVSGWNGEIAVKLKSGAGCQVRLPVPGAKSQLRAASLQLTGTTIVMRGTMMDHTTQLVWLFVLAVPIACIAWTVTHEEVFREPREYFITMSREGKNVLLRKFFYLFTCEYCFSHYVTIFMLILTRYKLLIFDWRGYLISGFALVWIANIYMSLYAFIRIDIKKERIKAKNEEEKLQNGK